MEQRFHAVMEVQRGSSKTEVAARYGVSRQTVHSWTVRYERDGVRGLEDRSHRPASRLMTLAEPRRNRDRRS